MDILSEAEVADLLDCTQSTVQEKARAGELPGMKFGRSWRFPRAALLEVLNKKALAKQWATGAKTPRAVSYATKGRKPPELPNLAFCKLE